MGLFDKLLKDSEKAVKNVFSEENREKASLFLNNVKTAVQDTAKEIASEENKEKASKFFNNVKTTVTEKAKEVASEENKEKAVRFFDNVKTTVSEKAKEVTSEENKEKVSNFFSQAKEKLSGGSFADLKKKLDEEADERARVKELFEEDDEDPRNCRDKIRDVLIHEFPDNKFMEDVCPRDLGGQGRFMNYSFLICQEDVAKVAIMIIGKTTTSHREYRWSKEFAQAHNITFLNFVEHYPNKVEYISERLHKYL
ncbi:MAG: hypothetical protein II704_00260 [Erysipelotrichaceae bacterium]|nr:hypothetical protein [Erysipelotrichaceae bacterium]